MNTAKGEYCNGSCMFVRLATTYDYLQQTTLKVKVKEVDLYSAFIVVPHTPCA